MRRIVFSLSFAVLLSTLSGALRPLSLDELSANAGVIVHGKITSLSCFEEDGLVFTRVAMERHATLKGEGDPEQPLVFRVPGGTLGTLRMKASEAPSFQLGEEWVLFVRYGTPHCDVYGWERGAFRVENGLVPGWSKAPVASFVAAVRRSLEKGR